MGCKCGVRVEASRDAAGTSRFWGKFPVTVRRADLKTGNPGSGKRRSGSGNPVPEQLQRLTGPSRQDRGTMVARSNGRFLTSE
jgi:hypothetical protein